MTAVRGELVELSTHAPASHETRHAPASHALVRVETEDGSRWYGLADELGRFLVLLPYPVLSDGFGGSPAGGERRRLSEQTWPVIVEVLYSPSRLEALPGSVLPDYRSVLNQDLASVWSANPDEGGSPGLSLSVELRFGREIVLKTHGRSKLFLSPLDSSP